MKKTIFILWLAAFIFSCSKKNDSPSITGKWNLTKKVVWNTPNFSIPQKDTVLNLTGEYVDFRTDGREYAYFSDGVSNYYDTLTYTVNGNILNTKKGNVSGTSDLPTLTSNSLTIHTTTADSNGKGEYWFFYTK